MASYGRDLQVRPAVDLFSTPGLGAPSSSAHASPEAFFKAFSDIFAARGLHSRVVSKLHFLGDGIEWGRPLCGSLPVECPPLHALAVHGPVVRTACFAETIWHVGATRS